MLVDGASHREASVAYKGKVLDEVAAKTDYARRYAMWLLNHPPEQQQPSGCLSMVPKFNKPWCLSGMRPIASGASDCTLFLLTLIKAFERQGYLYLTDLPEPPALHTLALHHAKP